MLGARRGDAWRGAESRDREVTLGGPLLRDGLGIFRCLARSWPNKWQ